MSIARRLSLAFKAKANKALDRMEDPRETLEYSYQRQLELLTNVRRGVGDVAASRARVESQMRALRLEQAKLDSQVMPTAGTEGERARVEALKRKAKVDSELSSLVAQQESLRAEQEKLSAAAERLAAKVKAFRVRKDAIKATYTAAEAQSRVSEVWSEISGAMDNAGIPYQRRREMLTQFWCSIKGMMASRERLEEQITALRQQQTELGGQASHALDAGQEDPAEQASAQEAEIDSQLSELAAQRDSLQEYEDKATAAYEQLAARVEELRLQERTVQGGDTQGGGPGEVSQAAFTDPEKTGADDMAAPSDSS
jgi:phage shock protein A